MAQREKHKDPANFVPVKYGEADDGQHSLAKNLILGAGLSCFVMLMLRHSKGKDATKGAKGAGK